MTLAQVSFYHIFGGLLASLGALFFVAGYRTSEFSDFLFCIVFFLSGWYLFKTPKTRRLKQEAKVKGLSEFRTADHSYVYANTGIAINKSNQTVSLHAGGNFKVYPFEKIRGWRYSSVTGEEVCGEGIGGAGRIALVEPRTVTELGLFIQTKDINHPDWQILFVPNHTAEKEMRKWMEILRQCLDKN